jgi:hypothetical protein
MKHEQAFPLRMSPYRQPMPFRRKRKAKKQETPEQTAARAERVRRYEVESQGDLMNGKGTELG